MFIDVYILYVDTYIRIYVYTKIYNYFHSFAFYKAVQSLSVFLGQVCTSFQNYLNSLHYTVIYFLFSFSQRITQKYPQNILPI